MFPTHIQPNYFVLMHQRSLRTSLNQYLHVPLLLSWDLHGDQKPGCRIDEILLTIQHVSKEPTLSKRLIKAQHIIGMGGGYVF